MMFWQWPALFIRASTAIWADDWPAAMFSPSGKPPV
jgi:hypothetical protein